MAFSIDKLDGLLNNNYVETEQNEYRNFYESSKHAAEKYLVKASGIAKIPIQILRPSVLGGNIMGSPNFFISKYMVFYLFAKFFYKSPSSELVRIRANHDGNLNIIPTDYDAAQVITKVFDTAVSQLNIVNSKGTNIFNGISRILETVNFKNFKLTQELMDTATDFESTLEQFYYETIGVHLTPYLTQTYEWDTTLLESILPLPKYNLKDYLVAAVGFAKNNGFRNQRW